MAWCGSPGGRFLMGPTTTSRSPGPSTPEPPTSGSAASSEPSQVAFRDWGRISRLDNPRAWVRRVAINQRGSFLRAYLRQQTRERDAAVRYEDDHIKLADEHAEVWQAVRTLPPLQAQVIALHYYEDYSVAQVAAALGRAPGTIKAQLHHGRRKLARLLGTETDRGRST